MEQSGSTMGEEPGWLELLFTFALAAAIPVVLGLTLICSLVGLTLWTKALLRRRAAGRTGQAQDPTSVREVREQR
ncbi:hypothetical protein ACWCWD_26920 [Streptomyces sp. NPDC001493]